MPPPVTPYAHLLSRNLRVARAAVPLSQEIVADRMNRLGFASWQRQTVHKVESGQRRVTVEELVGLMVVFEVDLTALAYPPHEQFGAVSLPGGTEIALPPARFAATDHPHQSIWPAE